MYHTFLLREPKECASLLPFTTFATSIITQCGGDTNIL